MWRANSTQFQYIALIRYCQNTHAARRPLQDALAEAEKKLLSMQDLASGEHAKVINLQQLRAQKDQFEAEVHRLQGLEQEVEHFRRIDVNPRDLETFVNNKSAIRHYLKLVPMLLEYVIQPILFVRQITYNMQAKREDAEATRKAWFCNAPGARTQLQGD
jgi:hypothetical protein